MTTDLLAISLRNLKEEIGASSGSAFATGTSPPPPPLISPSLPFAPQWAGPSEASAPDHVDTELTPQSAAVSTPLLVSSLTIPPETDSSTHSSAPNASTSTSITTTASSTTITSSHSPAPFIAAALSGDRGNGGGRVRPGGGGGGGGGEPPALRNGIKEIVNNAARPDQGLLSEKVFKMAFFHSKGPT